MAAYRYAIKMRGLPWQANTAMVQEFFGGISVAVEAITIMHDSSGTAFVYLANEKEANEAMRFNRKNMGRRYAGHHPPTANTTTNTIPDNINIHHHHHHPHHHHHHHQP